MAVCNTQDKIYLENFEKMKAHFLSLVVDLWAIRINVGKLSLTSFLLGMPDSLLCLPLGSFVCDLSIFICLFIQFRLFELVISFETPLFFLHSLIDLIVPSPGLLFPLTVL